MNADRFDAWTESLLERHLRELTLREVGRALKQLTQDYVQQRHRLAGGALEGRGKRAAFALYYGTRHFLLVREVLKRLAPPTGPDLPILDLGCGTGVAGAAWALETGPGARVTGYDTMTWAIDEARRTYRDLGVRGGALKQDIARLRWPDGPLAVMAAFTVNELADTERAKLRQRLLDNAAGGGRTLIVEPLARPITRAWWNDWAGAFTRAGGRADEWHFDLPLPERIHVMGKAAGLNPRELGARTLWLNGTG
ncbi:MAG: class I SAM-dependent methyltransferase [Planctomycetes bacterium]|nr:class I SAM-dependent methyltransferase [Planctomycetota bacterium]MCL4730803.1 methyltransferase domain-containing protein [Planctomycetota bacterium]